MKYLLIIICLKFTSTLTISAQSFNQNNISGNITNAIITHHQIHLNDFYTTGSSDSVKREPGRIRLIIEESIFGSLTGIMMALPVGALTVGLSNSSGFNRLEVGIIGMYGGYVLGTAYGVYLVAETDNENISFIKTLLSSMAGAAIGILIFKQADQQGFWSNSPLLFPIIASITYVNLVDKPSDKKICLNVSPLYCANSGQCMLNLSIKF